MGGGPMGRYLYQEAKRITVGLHGLSSGSGDSAQYPGLKNALPYLVFPSAPITGIMYGFQWTNAMYLLYLATLSLARRHRRV